MPDFFSSRTSSRSALQRVALEGEVLVEGGDAGVADEHVGIAEQPRLIGNRKADIFSRQNRPGFDERRDRLLGASGKRSFSRQSILQR